MSLITVIRPQQRASIARVRSTSCRGYVVELVPEEPGHPRLLQNLMGDVVHFRSLDRVRDALRDRGVQQATLYQQHACEELGALGVSDRAERGVPIL